MLIMTHLLHQGQYVVDNDAKYIDIPAHIDGDLNSNLNQFQFKIFNILKTYLKDFLLSLTMKSISFQDSHFLGFLIQNPVFLKLFLKTEQELENAIKKLPSNSTASYS